MEQLKQQTIDNEKQKINEYFDLVWAQKNLSLCNLVSLLDYLNLNYLFFRSLRNRKDTTSIKRYQNIKEAESALKSLRFEIMQTNSAYDKNINHPKLVSNLWIREHKKYDSELKKQELEIVDNFKKDIKIQIKQNKNSLNVEGIVNQWKK